MFHRRSALTDSGNGFSSALRGDRGAWGSRSETNIIGCHLVGEGTASSRSRELLAPLVMRASSPSLARAQRPHECCFSESESSKNKNKSYCFFWSSSRISQGERPILYSLHLMHGDTSEILWNTR